MWEDLLAASALVLVLEGVLPFLSPGRYRRAISGILTLGDSALRRLGLASMLAGLLLLNVVR